VRYLLGALCALACAQPAQATLYVQAPEPRYSKVLERVGRMPAADATVERRMTTCEPRFPACTTWDGNPEHIILWLPAGVPKLLFYHEAGHIFDIAELNERERIAYAVLNGESGWTGERFAEAYAYCAAQRRVSFPFTAGYGYQLIPDQHTANCWLIWRADN
jgi:hypothetical protein